LRREFGVQVWATDLWFSAANNLQFLHSAAWWKRHWERTGILSIDVADTLPDGWRLWRDWQAVVAPDNAVEIQAVEADRGTYLGYVRLAGRRLADARLEEPIVSVPREYAKKPLLRSSQESAATDQP
jgi:hypothetical protein